MKKLIILLSGIILFFGSCKLQFAPPTVSRTEDFKITKMTAEGIEGEVTINIKNPNTIGFNIYKSYFDVTYAGTNLGRAYMKKKMRIPGNSDKTHTFFLKGDFKNISLAEITKLINGKSANLEIAGKLKVGKWFYKKKFDINHKQRVQLTK